jgi:type IV pilus assembly protein PilM
LNSKTYLQQDFSGFVFDRYIIPAANGAQSEKKKGDSMKAKMLLAGAKGRSVEDLSTAIKSAGLVPDHIVPSLIGLANSFEQAVPEVHSKGVVALVDIGFKSSIICMIQEGELILSRVVNIGGDKLTQGLAELMNISYAEAEGIKIGMPTEVQSHLETLVAPLIRELRASIDFFEHQQDRTVSQIYLSGGSARSECLVETLQGGIGLECKNWNPAGTLELALAPQQATEMEQVAPQLAVAIGAALTAL